MDYTDVNYNNNATFTCSLSIWNKCDPDFTDYNGDGCGWYASRGCNWGFSNKLYIGWGKYTASQGIQTGLLCPVCGCTEENGPINMWINESNARSIDAFGPSIKEIRNNPKEDY